MKHDVPQYSEPIIDKKIVTFNERPQEDKVTNGNYEETSTLVRETVLLYKIRAFTRKFRCLRNVL